MEETEKKEIPVKTLVSDLPPEKNKGDEIIQDEPAPSTTKVGIVFVGTLELFY